MSISGPGHITRTSAALAAAIALTVSVAPSQAMRATADGPGYGAPTVGACSTMTATQAAARADHSTRVPCSRTHTARVAGVVSLPARLSYSSGIQKLYRVIADRCRPKLNAVLGRTDRARDSTAYDLVWFLPTKAERRHGARWLSCSVVLRQGSRLAALPTNRTPMLPSGRLRDGIRRCLLEDTSQIITTRCSATHGWRATGSFTVARQHYPGAKVLNRKARTKCAGRVQAHKPYRWTYSTKIDWQVSGDHAVICYSQTRH
jgi:hypothetical protein